MLPGGAFLRDWLRPGPVPGVRYFAIASDYAATHPGLASWAADRLSSDVFRGEANDLVVPTASVYDPAGSGLFPIGEAHRSVLPHGAGVTHVGYFAHEPAREAILGWLA